MPKYSLPVDCINEIFKYFENDKSSLYSCLLVNRLWCRTIIPILWGRSFSLSKINSSLSLTEIYLSFLNEEEKQLRNYHPELYPTFKETLFNYPSFLKEFYYETMFLSVKFWVKTSITPQSHNSQYNSQLISKVSCKISQSLFKMFLRNNAQINLINIKLSENNPDLPYMPNFQSSFSNLKNFQFSFNFQSFYTLPNTYSFLKSLPQSCNTLSRIFINSHFNNNDDDKEEIFFNIIKTQRNIKKFIINPHGIIPKSILNSIIDQSSLVLIHFIETKFVNLFPFEILLNCNNLKFLLIVNCCECNTSSDTSQITISAKDIKCKIDTLHLKNNNLPSLTTSNLIQLLGVNLTTLCLDRTTPCVTLNTLLIQCPNITHLMLTFDMINFKSIQTIISNLNLSYFEIRSFGWADELISNLGNYLPVSLKYLGLSCFFDSEALYMLLKNCKCQLRGLNIIVFTEDYLNIIIDYAKLNKEFRLLGIDGFFHEEENEETLKILREETNVKIVDPDEIKLKLSPLYFDYLFKSNNY